MYSKTLLFRNPGDQEKFQYMKDSLYQGWSGWDLLFTYTYDCHIYGFQNISEQDIKIQLYFL